MIIPYILSFAKPIFLEMAYTQRESLE